MMLRHLLAALLLLCLPCAAWSQDRAIEWRPLSVIRFDNVDALESDSGQLAAFIRSIRNDGRFVPPLSSLIGPAIRNTTFFGFSYEGWLEGLLLVPHHPGDWGSVWVFPVDNRNEYLSHLVSMGFTEYEGMDGVTELREMDEEGKFTAWYLEWLPGDIAVFGSRRDTVIAARRIYEEESASRGLLANATGGYVRPDIIVSLDTDALTAWRDSDPGSYWWRSVIDRLTQDIIEYWQPTPARRRLITNMSADFATLPRLAERVFLNVWFEETGVNWRIDIITDPQPSPRRSDLGLFRSLPARTALGYCAPMTDRDWQQITANLGQLLLSAAGGVVSAEARAEAMRLLELLTRAGIRQTAAAWVPPPPDEPETGLCRLLLYQCTNPEYMSQAWDIVRGQLGSATAITQALAQIGWRVQTTQDAELDNTIYLTIRPVAGSRDEDQPWDSAAYTAVINDGIVAIAMGGIREDPDEMRRALEWRTRLAREAAVASDTGPASIRNAFVGMGGQGAAFIAMLDPVLFLQLAMIESADWRPLSPDRSESASTQFAREMLEYSSGGSWSLVGEDSPTGRIYTGLLPWESLARLSGVLGITELVGSD